MGATETHISSPTPFGRKLRVELQQRGWGIRTLARAMAENGKTPERTESIRRQLKRYVADVGPVTPTVGTRRFIEETLGLERDALADDDEESDPVTDLMNALARFVDSRRPAESVWDRVTERRA